MVHDLSERTDVVFDDERIVVNAGVMLAVTRTKESARLRYQIEVAGQLGHACVRGHCAPPARPGRIATRPVGVTAAPVSICQGPSRIPSGGQIIPRPCRDLWGRPRCGDADRPPAERARGASGVGGRCAPLEAPPGGPGSCAGEKRRAGRRSAGLRRGAAGDRSPVFAVLRRV